MRKPFRTLGMFLVERGFDLLASGMGRARPQRASQSKAEFRVPGVSRSVDRRPCGPSPHTTAKGALGGSQWWRASAVDVSHASPGKAVPVRRNCDDGDSVDPRSTPIPRKNRGCRPLVHHDADGPDTQSNPAAGEQTRTDTPAASVGGMEYETTVVGCGRDSTIWQHWPD